MAKFNIETGQIEESTPEEIADFENSISSGDEFIPDKYPEMYAIADVSIQDGSISSVKISANISAVFYIEVGVYWVFFSEAQQNTDYIPLCYNQNHSVFVSKKTEDYFVVNAILDGQSSDPSNFSVEVKRVQ